MAYSTPAMVRQALLPSSDGQVPSPPSNSAADLSDVQLEDAIAEADSTIDSYLAKFYTVPVAGDPTPHPVDYWSRNIAAYNATLTFRKGLDLAETDPIVRRFNATMAALKQVAAGQAVLPLPATTPSQDTTSGAGAPVNPYDGDLFTPDDFLVQPLTTGGFVPGFWRNP